MKKNICISYVRKCSRNTDELTEKRYLMREFKKFIGYCDLSNIYVENGLKDKFNDFVNKKVGKNKKNNR
jgi:hypothetical protein